MTVKVLYRYERENGKVTVSTEKPKDTEYTEMYRLIADSGNVLAKEDTVVTCIDTDTTVGWEEKIQEEVENDEVVE